MSLEMPKVVTVYEQGRPFHDLGLAVVQHSVSYTFIDSRSADGFSSWVNGAEQECTQVDVDVCCKPLTGSFASQALNRFVAKALLGGRPDCLLIKGLYGCTADLPRLAALMGVPVLFDLSDSPALVGSLEASAEQSLVDALRRCSAILLHDFEFPEDTTWQELLEGRVIPSGLLPEKLATLGEGTAAGRHFDYSRYEFLQRDPPLLAAMQRGDVVHFQGSDNILDLACGAGIFLDCLRREGQAAVGVERDPIIAEYGRGMGLEIVTQDAVEYLRTSGKAYSGIYCSHFVEHLPMDALPEFFKDLYRGLTPGGVAVLVFPDPESIRSQLLGFWRDPEHVRFYHPELIKSLAESAGLAVEWTSYEDQPHEVVPFELTPPELPPMDSVGKLPAREGGGGAWNQMLEFFGLQSVKQAQRSERHWLAWSTQLLRVIEQQRQAIDVLSERTETLWAVNKTWGWNDNVTLRLRRPA